MSLFEVSPYSVLLCRQQEQDSLTGRGGSMGLSWTDTLVLTFAYLWLSFFVSLSLSF